MRTTQGERFYIILISVCFASGFVMHKMNEKVKEQREEIKALKSKENCDCDWCLEGSY